MREMDEKTRRVLRRACAHFKTGIRKTFIVLDRVCKLEPASSGYVKKVFKETNVAFLHLTTMVEGMPHFQSRVAVELTPEEIFKTVQLVQCREVIDG